MLIIQLFLILFFLFAIIKVLARYRAGDVAIGWTLFWVLLWLVAGVVVLKPEWTMPISRWFGVGRGSDLVMYFSVALLFYLFFRIMTRIERMERNITKVTREAAVRGTRDGGQRDE